MNQFANAIGIDVSKKQLDAYDYAHRLFIKVSNTPEGFKQLLKWAKLNNKDVSRTLFCFEHTGLYSLPLAVHFSKLNIPTVIVSGLELKRSAGLHRGKSDATDAVAIAQYAYLRRDHVKLYELPSTQLLQLKSLLSLRERMVSQRAGYIASRREMKTSLKAIKPSESIFQVQIQMIRDLTKQISIIEKEILNVIRKDEKLNKAYDLATSIKGVGPIVGSTILAYTSCFTAFDDWRKFACYCGIVPFPKESGTSFKSRRKVSHFANKRIKALLSNAACTSIQFNPEMKLYYERRLSEGKNKMSTQNIIRNKIVARIFAVVQRGTPYVDTSKYAA